MSGSPPASGYTDTLGVNLYTPTLNCGVYMYNGTFGGEGIPLIAIPCSIFQLNIFSQADTEDGWILYPGWKVIVYREAGYSNETYTVDNTNGTSMLSYQVDPNLNNHAVSVRVYFRGVEFRLNLFS